MTDGYQWGKSWIVYFWAEVFQTLRYISIFEWVLLIGGSKVRNAAFVEIWVFLNSVLAIAALAYCSAGIPHPTTCFMNAIFIYAAIRSFEIFVYQVNVLLFDEFRAKISGKEYFVHGYRRIVLLLIHNYFELVCWFGVIYVFFYRNGDLSMLQGYPEPTFFSIFRDSLLLMFSFTADRYDAANDLGLFLFTMHATVGIFMTVLVFARFLALLPTPASKDPQEGTSTPDEPAHGKEHAETQPSD